MARLSHGGDIHSRRTTFDMAGEQQTQNDKSERVRGCDISGD